MRRRAVNPSSARCHTTIEVSSVCLSVPRAWARSLLGANFSVTDEQRIVRRGHAQSPPNGREPGTLRLYRRAFAKQRLDLILEGVFVHHACVRLRNLPVTADEQSHGERRESAVSVG